MVAPLLLVCIYCEGREVVAGERLLCWRARGWVGRQTLKLHVELSQSVTALLSSDHLLIPLLKIWRVLYQFLYRVEIQQVLDY